MNINQLQNYITGSRAVEVAAGIEAAIDAGDLAPGERLPTVRALAGALGASPTTVSAAFGALRRRGLVMGQGRRGTTVSQRAPLTALMGPVLPLPAGVRDLATGNPNPAFLPDLRPALDDIEAGPHLYGGDVVHPALLRLARRSFAASHIPTEAVTITSGALDGLERVLQAYLRPGDRVAVEDPGFTGFLHLAAGMGLEAVPVEIDDAGPIPDSVEQVLRAGANAIVLSPRAQNPRGAALDPKRIAALQPLFRAHPEVLLVEDDHAGVVSGAPALSLCSDPPERWAVVRSVSKAYGPDLRLAVMASDPATLARVDERQLIGVRWVSFILQQTVVALWKDAAVKKRVREGARAYTRGRCMLIDALAARGIAAYGRSGLNVWVPVPEEAAALRALLDAGIAVAPGERFRLRSEPAVRITITTLEPEDAETIAATLARVLTPQRRTLVS